MVKRSRSRGRSSASSSQSSSSYVSSSQEKSDRDDLEIDCLTRYVSNSMTLKALENKGIKKLFPIQYTTFKAIKKGKDLIAKDRTGSGKTIAYALPILQKLRANRCFNTDHTRFLIICPTRQLSIQVKNQINTLRHSSRDFRVVNVYGGTHIGQQISQIREGANVIVGTPGRLIDMLNRDVIQLSRLSTLCLDEADEMLKMGFQEDIEKIFGFVKKMAKQRPQILLFSATIPEWVMGISEKYLRDNRLFIDMIKDQNIKTSKTIEHLAINCPYHSRNSSIADVVSCYGGRHGRTIIFCETKKQANQIILKANLKQEAQVLHGDIPQKQREVTFKSFKEGKLKCLVSTNVAARGLDIPQVDLIVQLDPPKDVETYIHRAGRTGRAGRQGTCVTFYNQRSKDLIDRVERVAKIKFKRVGAPQPQDIMKATARDIGISLKMVSEEVIPYFNEIALQLIHEEGAEKALSKALALISGHTEKVQQRSLLTSMDGYITYLIKFNNEFHSPSYVFGFLRKMLSQRTCDDVKGMKKMNDHKSAAFDLPVEYKNEIEELSKRLSNEAQGVRLEIAKTLQGLEEEDRRIGGRERFENHHFHERRGQSDRRKLEVFVGGLGNSTSEADLREFFRRKGVQVVSLRVIKDPSTGTSKGIAFAELSDDYSYRDALALDGVRFQSHSLRINPSKSR